MHEEKMSGAVLNAPPQRTCLLLMQQYKCRILTVLSITLLSIILVETDYKAVLYDWTLDSLDCWHMLGYTIMKLLSVSLLLTPNTPSNTHLCPQLHPIVPQTQSKTMGNSTYASCCMNFISKNATSLLAITV